MPYRCLSKLNAKRVLIVTSDYHTRRALSIFSELLPQYEWSAVGVVVGTDCDVAQSVPSRSHSEGMGEIDLLGSRDETVP